MYSIEKTGCEIIVADDSSDLVIAVGVGGSPMVIPVGGSGSGTWSGHHTPGFGNGAYDEWKSANFKRPVKNHSIGGKVAGTKDLSYMDRFGTTSVHQIPALLDVVGWTVKDKDITWSIASPSSDMYAVFTNDTMDERAPVVLGIDNQNIVAKEIVPVRFWGIGSTRSVMPALTKSGSVHFYSRTSGRPDIVRDTNAETRFNTVLSGLGLPAADAVPIAIVPLGLYESDHPDQDFGVILSGGTMLRPDSPYFGNYDSIAYLTEGVVRYKDGVKLSLSPNIVWDGSHDVMMPLYRSELTGTSDIFEIWRKPHASSPRTVVNYADGTFELLESSTTLTPSRAPYDIIFTPSAIYAVYKGYELELLHGTGPSSVTGIVNYGRFASINHELIDVNYPDTMDLRTIADFVQWLDDTYTFTSVTCQGVYSGQSNCIGTNGIVSFSGAIVDDILLMRTDGTLTYVDGTEFTLGNYADNDAWFTAFMGMTDAQHGSHVIRKTGQKLGEVTAQRFFRSLGSAGATDLDVSFGASENTKEDFSWADLR